MRRRCRRTDEAHLAENGHGAAPGTVSAPPLRGDFAVATSGTNAGRALTRAGHVPPGSLTLVFDSDVGILLVLAEAFGRHARALHFTDSLTSPLSATGSRSLDVWLLHAVGGAASLADRSNSPTNEIRTTDSHVRANQK